MKICSPVIFLNLLTFQLVIQVLQNDPDHLDQRQDERAKCQGACVVSGQQEEAQANREREPNTPTSPRTQIYQRKSSFSPEGPSQRGEDGEGGNVLGLFEGPVVRGEGPWQRDLAQGGHEVGAPEEEEHVVELKQDEVIVVEGLPAVEGKQALGIGALSRNVRDVECLQREKRGVITDFMWSTRDALSSAGRVLLEAHLRVAGLARVLALRVVEHLVHLLIGRGQEAAQGNQSRSLNPW